MKETLIDILRCPVCASGLDIIQRDVVNEDGQIQEGLLSCLKCQEPYPIINGLPRFVPSSNYADSFGFEWRLYGRVQIDSFSGNRISRDRYEATTGWLPDSKKDQLILDAGCGGGRFAEIALTTGAMVVAFDYSNCIDFTKTNFTGRDDSLHLLQADISKMPFKPVFDAVYCMGVLQHTPNPQESLRCLYNVLKPGGELVVDVYEKPEVRRRFVSYLNPQKWFWQPLFKRIPHKVLHRFIQLYVRLFLSLDTVVLRRIGKGGIAEWCLQAIKHSFPIISNHSLDFPFLSQQYKLLWAIMNTLDHYSPKYTQPQTRTTMRRWAEELGLKNIEVFVKPGCGDGTALVLKGIK
jgi:SAM-dependent methyltransferase